MFFSHFEDGLRRLAPAILLACALQVAGAAKAQDIDPATIAIGPGDVAVSGFSGTKLAAEAVLPGIDPVDKTVIDVDGAALRIFDMSDLGSPPGGQRVQPPVKLEVKARDIGQVFGLAFGAPSVDGVPDLYAAATSAYGVQIVAAEPGEDGMAVRLRQGRPGARFMEGMIGAPRGASPGSIWKIDGATGEVTLFADTASGGVVNSGSGLGALAFDPQSRSLYASDLDTGLIHRFGPDAAYLGHFDHGVAGRPARGLTSIADDGRRMDIESPAFRPDDASTWGMTQPERRVHGLAVHAGRLYYAVAEGPEIWSVGLGADGGFGPDIRFELSVRIDQPQPVTDIVFDAQGRMTLAMRGSPTSNYDYGRFAGADGTPVLRYLWEPEDSSGPGRWLPEPQYYAIGFSGAQRNGTGGVGLQYAYGPDGRIDLGACGRTLLVTGDALPDGGIGSGMQVNDAALVRPANVPPVRSAFVVYDDRRADAELRGHVGDVEVYQPCDLQRADGFEPDLPQQAGSPARMPWPPVTELPEAIDMLPPFDAFPIDIDGLPPPMGGSDRGGGGLRIEKKATVASCSDKGGCAFEINVTNTGDAPVPGPVEVIDDISSAKAKITSGPDAPWTCSAGTPFRCTHPGPVAPKQSLPLRLTFAPDTGGAKEVKNCAVLASTKPAQTPTAPPAPAVMVPPAISKEFKGLRVVKVPLSATCAAGAGGCEWEITVTNIDAVPLTGTLSFDDNLFFRDTVTDKAVEAADIVLESTASNPPVSCKKSKPHQFDCRLDNLTLAVNQSFTFKYALKVDAPADTAATLLQNMLFLSFAGKGPVSSAAASSSVLLDPPLKVLQPMPPQPGQAEPASEQCATIPLEQKAPDQPQAGPLQIQKRALNKSCDFSMGVGCDFEVTVVNTTAAPFSGLVEIDDTVTGDGALFGATAMKNGPTARWSCKKSGQAFACFNPAVAIPANGKTAFMAGFGLGPGTGAVKEMKNCATIKGTANTACATIASQQPGQPAPDQPAPGQAQLKIDKNATVTTCGLKGGGCSFEIAVTNTGTAPYTGPIEISDTPRLFDANGQAVGTALINTPGPAAPWTCAPNGQNFSCALPSVTLAPGQRTKLDITFKPAGNPQGAVRIENCARLKDDPACDKILLSDKSGAKLRPEKTFISGDCRTSCEFSIRVRNVGNEPYSGEIALSDIITDQTGAQVESTLISVGGAWECSTPAPTVHMCRLPTPVSQMASGSSVEFRLRLKVKKLALEGKNCAFILSKPDGVRDNEQPGRCAKVSIPGPIVTQKLPDFDVKLPVLVSRPNIAIEKRALAQHCALTGPCPFETIIRNKGNAPYRGNLVIFETIASSHAMSQFFPHPAGISCVSDGSFKQNRVCTLNDVKLAAGAGMSFAVNIYPSFFKGGVSPDLTSCALFMAARSTGNDPNTVTSDNEACATIHLDPFAVSIEKSGDQSCQPGGLCRFELDIFNSGPVDHQDPVTIADNLSGIGAAQIVSITGAVPFPCAPQPTQIPFNCTSPGNFPLAVGEHRRYAMTVRMPEAAAGASFVNCASVQPRQAPGLALDLVADRPTTGEGAKDTACHEVRLEPAAPAPLPTSVDTCLGGMAMTASGRCACPAGTEWSGRRCVGPTEPASSSGGYDTSKSPDAEQRPRCPSGQVWQSGRCTPAETKRRPECPAERPVGTPPNCCPRGTVFERGECRVVPVKKKAVCAPTMIGTPPNCRCPEGTEFKQGACRRKPVQRCTGGMVGTPPDCACPAGTRYSRKSGKKGIVCVPDAPAQQQAPRAQCPEGYFGRPPFCKRTKPLPDKPAPRQEERCPLGMTGTPPNCCPPGTRSIDGVCRKPQPDPAPAARCPEGKTGRPPYCRDIKRVPDKIIRLPKNTGPILLKCPSYQVGTYPDCRCPAGMTGAKCDQVLVK